MNTVQKRSILNTENKQISSTGARAIIILTALMNSPKSYDEINTILTQCGVLDKPYSIDALRLDIKTLKKIGCSFSKATKKTDRKYVLLEHPFKIKLTKEDIDLVRSCYKYLCRKTSPEKLFEFHKLFLKLANMTEDPYLKEEIKGISVYKRINNDLLESLFSRKTIHNIVTIEYLNVTTGKIAQYKISVEKFSSRNEKIYLDCFNHTLNRRSFLNISRIKSVLSTIYDKNVNYGTDTCIEYKLNNYKKYYLDENETILKTSEGIAYIHGKYLNEFIAKQRILSFGADCTLLYPENMRIEIIELLKKMSMKYQ